MTDTKRTAPAQPASPYAFARPTTIAQACQPSAAELERRAAVEAAARARAAQAARAIAPSANQPVAIPPPAKATLSPKAQRLIDDMANPQSRTGVRNVDQLRSRLGELSMDELWQFGQEVRNRGWVGMINLGRGLWAARSYRNQCTAVGGNPSNAATGQRMLPIIMQDPVAVGIANDVLKRARGG